MKVFRSIISILLTLLSAFLFLTAVLSLPQGAIGLIGGDTSHMPLLFIAGGLFYFVLGSAAYYLAHLVDRDFHNKLFRLINGILIRKLFLWMNVILFVVSSAMFVYIFILRP